MMPQKYCTACGALLARGMRFCSQCGQPLTMPGSAAPQLPPFPAVPPQAPPDPTVRGYDEQILGIIPFLEQGLLSVIHYSLIVTTRRLIFCTWDPGTDEAMSDAEDAVMLESCSIGETADEIAHFRQKDWSAGPWQRYRSMALDSIISGAPGSVSVPLADIVHAEIVCENRTSTLDKLHLRDTNRDQVFDLMYSQGPCLFGILHPLLGEKVSITGHLHRRHGLDRLLSGEEYK
jgi:hypothetical protein